MKKTLAALAVLGAFAAGSAAAADVTLYGYVDFALKYSHVDNDDGKDATDKLEMISGGQSGSRFGLKGVEDLGNGMKVGFVLENGFNADDGSLANNSRLFGRESQANIQGAFGTLSFGRVGQINSANGSYGITGIFSPFGTSWAGSVEGSTYMVGYSRVDNAVTYVSPEFAGFKVYAQYSFDVNTKAKMDEGKTTADRYYGLGVTYKNGPMNLVALVDSYNWSSKQGDDLTSDDDTDDAYTFSLGGNYDFGFMKAYLGAQYFDNMFKKTYDWNGDDTDRDAYAAIGTHGQFKGYGITAGVDAPVLGGTAMFAVGYSDTEQTEAKEGFDKEKMTRLGASVGYTYNLSKRTNLYTVLSYYKDKYEDEVTTVNEKEVAGDRDPSSTMFWVGMRHRF